jgi:hypothetical protein
VENHRKGSKDLSQIEAAVIEHGEQKLSAPSTVGAHLKRMQERASVKNLLAFEKKVNERFAKRAQATVYG